MKNYLTKPNFELQTKGTTKPNTSSGSGSGNILPPPPPKPSTNKN